MNGSPRAKAPSKAKTKPKQQEELVLRDTDVICGRGTGTASFIGNVEFRFICFKVKNIYRHAQRQEKSKIAQMIMDLIAAQEPPGRFVELVEGTEVAERRCVLTPFEQALEKTCQALREKKNGCPRQYRHFENKRMQENTSKLPKISLETLSKFVKDIEGMVQTVTDSPTILDKMPLVRERQSLRKTSRPMKVLDQVSRESDSQDEAWSPKSTKEARSTPRKRASASDGVKGKRIKSPEVKSVSMRYPAPKLLQPKSERTIIIDDDSSSEDESLPENSIQARIFSLNRPSGQSATVVTGGHSELKKQAEPTQGSRSLCMFEGAVDDFYVQDNSSDRRLDDRYGKYPFVPYPFCFLQSLSLLNEHIEPKNLTATHILNAFSMEKAEAARTRMG